MSRKWLSEIRESRGLTQKQAGVKAGFSESYHSLIESGGRNPPVNTAQAIAAVLSFPWEWFYDEERREREYPEFIAAITAAKKSA